MVASGFDDGRDGREIRGGGRADAQEDDRAPMRAREF
jgi:hypothetical protein